MNSDSHQRFTLCIFEGLLSVTWAQALWLPVGGWGCEWLTLGYFRLILGSVQSHTSVCVCVWGRLTPIRPQTSATSTSSPDEAPHISIKTWETWEYKHTAGFRLAGLMDRETMSVCNSISCVRFWQKETAAVSRAHNEPGMRKNVVWWETKTKAQDKTWNRLVSAQQHNELLFHSKLICETSGWLSVRRRVTEFRIVSRLILQETTRDAGKQKSTFGFPVRNV